jgi:hypothetical protein
MTCKIMYEVFFDVKTKKPTTSGVIFRDKKFAREFQAERRDTRWKIRPVEICEGKIKRRSKRSFTGHRR